MRRSARTRLVVGIVSTVVAVIALIAVSLSGGPEDDPTTGGGTSDRSSTTTSALDVVQPLEAPTTSVEVPEEWHPKGSSLYSDRKPTGEEEQSGAAGSDGDPTDSAPSRSSVPESTSGTHTDLGD